MHRTRFRPTCNGPLHIGGAYVAYQNYKAAKSLGGEFVIIEDDAVIEWTKGNPNMPVAADLHAIADSHREDLEWLGIAPDALVFASTLRAWHEAAAAKLGLQSADLQWPHLNTQCMSVAGTGLTAGYHAWLVAGRVSDDHELGVTAFVRGADLLSECQLYDHFARELYGQAYSVRQDYVPIVIAPDTYAKLSKSTTGREGTIAYCREIGMAPEILIDAFSRGGEAPPTDPPISAKHWQTAQYWYGQSAWRCIELPEDAMAEYRRCVEVREGGCKRDTTKQQGQR